MTKRSLNKINSYLHLFRTQQTAALGCNRHSIGTDCSLCTLATLFHPNCSSASRVGIKNREITGRPDAWRHHVSVAQSDITDRKTTEKAEQLVKKVLKKS